MQATKPDKLSSSNFLFQQQISNEKERKVEDVLTYQHIKITLAAEQKTLKFNYTYLHT